METTEYEKKIIEEIIHKRSANKRKWGHLLFAIIESKISDKIITIDEIVNWLNNEGLIISDNAVWKLIGTYKKINLNEIKNNSREENTTKKIITVVKENVKVDSEKENSESDSNEKLIEDLNRQMREKSLQAQNKNNGFEGFEKLIKNK